MIGKYTLENGNERTRKHFLSKFPNLPESTIRHFMKAYRDELEKKRRKADPQPVVEIAAKPKGCPPILLDLAEKMLKFLKAIRSKGSVENIHVVQAATDTLIASNPSSSTHLQNFSKPHSWVQSLYRCMGYTQALLHDLLFLKDSTVNAEEITCRILTAKSRNMGFLRSNPVIICICGQVNYGSKGINSCSHQRCHR